MPLLPVSAWSPFASSSIGHASSRGRVARRGVASLLLFPVRGHHRPNNAWRLRWSVISLRERHFRQIGGQGRRPGDAVWNGAAKPADSPPFA